MRKHAILLGAVLLGLALLSYAQAPIANRSSTSRLPQNTSEAKQSRSTLNGLRPHVQSPILNQLGELTASAGASGNRLGVSVAVSGNTVVAGGPGAAYVYVMPGTGWANATQIAELSASDGSSIEGVAISGNTIVGAASDGAAYVFVEPPTGWTNMTETAKLTTSNGDGLSSVAISGNTVVAGAGSGAAYVFVEPPNGWASMTETAKLTTSNGDSLTGVAISGSTVAAGAVVGNNDNGAAYVFVEPASGWANMTQTAELTASDGESDDFLGCGVGISGDTVVAGAPNAQIGSNGWQGALYVFVEPTGGWTDMTQTAKLTASDGGPSDQLGNGAAISGNTVVGGAPQYEPWSPGNGKGYVFVEPASGWTNETQTAELVASDGQQCAALGVDVAVSGRTAVAGAPDFCAAPESSSPGAYVFCAFTDGVSTCPTNVNFATQLILTPSSPQMVILNNSGSASLDITSIVASPNFAQRNNCGSSLAMGADCTIGTIFKPRSINTITGTLTITDNAPNSPQTVPLTGVGTAVTLLPSSLNFGNQTVGTTSPPQVVTLTNYAPKAVTIFSADFTGTNHSSFSVQSTTCGKTLSAGESCTANITFTPHSTGVKSATFNVNDNAGASPQTVSLSGTGT